MKLVSIALVLILCCSYCYNSRIIVGDTKPQRMVKVGSTWNHHLLCGLIPIGGAVNAEDYVGERDDYVVKQI